MVVAVVAMRVVQMTVDQINDMVPVRYRFMTAIRSVYMVHIVPLTVMLRGAIGRIFFRHIDQMLLNCTRFELMMQVTIMEGIGVAIVSNGGMGLMLMTIRHKSPLFQAVEERKKQTGNTRNIIIIRRGRSRKPHRPESIGPGM